MSVRLERTTSARNTRSDCHREKPEWGLGTVVRTEPGRVEIEFVEVDKKTLRDTLPQLAFDEDE